MKATVNEPTVTLTVTQEELRALYLVLSNYLEARPADPLRGLVDMRWEIGSTLDLLDQIEK